MVAKIANDNYFNIAPNFQFFKMTFSVTFIEEQL